MENLYDFGSKIMSIFEAVMGMDFTSEIVPMLIMWAIGGLLIYLAIAKDMEPTLLLPMGFGTILVNLPLALTEGVISEHGAIEVLYNAGVANELFPLILFIGIGAMIDFGPLLTKWALTQAGDIQPMSYEVKNRRQHKLEKAGKA